MPHPFSVDEDKKRSGALLVTLVIAANPLTHNSVCSLRTCLPCSTAAWHLCRRSQAGLLTTAVRLFLLLHRAGITLILRFLYTVDVFKNLAPPSGAPTTVRRLLT